MEQPFHSLRSAQTNRLTQQKIFGLLAAIALQAGFVYALISGLAATLIQKLPQELKVAVEQEKVIPKPPPPPPPQVDLPPPPSAPPPEINIQVDTQASPITVSNKPPPPAPVHQAVVSPVSIGRQHECGSKFYPEVSMRLNEEGVTTISFHIMTDGSVSNVVIAKSSGFSRLDEASIPCATRWHYTPKTVDGVPIETDWQANVVWKLH